METPMPRKKILWLTIAFFFVLTFLVYGASLGNEFVHFDDNLLIFENPAVQELTPRSITWAFTHFDPELYIPLTFLSYQFDHIIGGLNPLIYHLHKGLLCGLLFALHPLHTEAVVWAAARKDLTSTFWMLISLTSYLWYRQSNQRFCYHTSMAAFLLALLAKVSVLLLPLMLLLIDWRGGRKFNRRTWVDKVPFALLSVIFGCIAIFGKQSVLADSQLKASVLMAGKSTVFYLQKVVAPLKLSVIYPYNEAITFSSPDFWIPALILLVLALLVLLSTKKTKEVLFGVLLFLIFLAPSYTNYAKAGDIFFASDRYVYVPSIGIFFLIALGVMTLRSHLPKTGARIVNVLLITALITMGTLAHKQSLVWKNTHTLFDHVLTLYDYSYLAQNKVGTKLWEQGEYAEAIERLEASIAIKPNYRAYYNLGLVYLSLGEDGRALEMNLQSLELNPHYAFSHINAGYLYWKGADLERSRVHLEQAVELAPRDTDALTNLAGLNIAEGRMEEARRLLERALKIDPENENALGLMTRVSHE